MTNWVHYSDSNSTILLQSKKQIAATSRSDFLKPNGLWITPEDTERNWKDWCEAEDFRRERLSHVHDVSFKANAKLCRIETPEQLVAFDKEYSGQVAGIPRFHWIHWNRVAEKFDGILISPYQWNFRLSHMRWYYGWDCASGCIWNKDVISVIPRPIQPKLLEYKHETEQVS